MELALKAVKLGSLGPCGSRKPANRVRKRQGCYVGRERVTICGGNTYGASLRLAHVTCLDSAQFPAPDKRKTKVDSSQEGPTRTELKLLKDLQDFIASCDLPPNVVPTTAELTRHGRSARKHAHERGFCRKDLANRVRRKGYKHVEHLLEHARIADAGENTQSEGVIVPPSSSVENNVTGNYNIELSSIKEENTVYVEVEEPSDVGSSADGTFEEFNSKPKYTNLNGHASLSEKLVGEASGDEVEHVPESDSHQRIRREVAELALQAESFQDSLEDTNRDSAGSSQPVVSSLAITNEDGGLSSMEEEYETFDMADDEDDVDEESYDDEDNDEDARKIPDRPDPKSQSPDDIVYQKAALLKVKLLQYFDSRSEDFKEANSFPLANRMKQKVASHQELAQTDLGDIQAQVAQPPKELEQLKGLLHSRELELAEVSKQLEEAKAMLSLARAKATAELIHVKQLTVEQDGRVQAAEQVISNMKQVHLEWFGEASRVELAGSFNGWQHCILLEPDFTSEIPKPDGVRGPMMWGTYLCLYPGVYEIKFIVDGNWQVDHRREVVTRQSNQNNLLRVELV